MVTYATVVLEVSCSISESDKIFVCFVKYWLPCLRGLYIYNIYVFIKNMIYINISSLLLLVQDLLSLGLDSVVC